MEPSLSPSSLAILSTAAAAYKPPDDDYYEEDDFEFTPLLLRPQRRRRRSTRTERRRTIHAAATLAQLQSPAQSARRGAPSVAPVAATTPASRKVRWHDMAFGSVRVPAAMDMGEIRRRLKARQAAGGGGNEATSAAAGWAPWRLIRSLSCKGVEAVAAAAAPVRLV